MAYFARGRNVLSIDNKAAAKIGNARLKDPLLEGSPGNDGHIFSLNLSAEFGTELGAEVRVVVAELALISYS